MYRATLQVETDVLQAVAETARDATRKMRRAAGIVARGASAQALIADLSKEPEPPEYPIRWASDRQRKAVMAKLRRADDLPFQRKHRLSRGWRMVLSSLLGDNGGVFTAENSAPEADFVQGERQQRYLSKWPLARLVIRQHEAPMEDELINAWYGVVRVT